MNDRNACDWPNDESSEDRFTRAFHGVPFGAAILTEADARVVDVNDRALELLALSRSMAIGKTLDALDVVAESGSWLGAVRRAVVGRGRAVRLRRATGEVVEVLVWFQPLETDGERSVLVLLQDQRETRHLETQLILAQKAEAVGRLAGAVAHDLNNLLTAIVGSTEIARHRLHEPSMLSQDLDHVVHAADRAASLTSRLLQYGRGQAESPQTIDLGEAVREAERTVRQLAGEGVSTELAVPPVTMQVRMEPAEFERILVNLVVNARDAMAHGGRLRIALQPRAIDQAAAVLRRDAWPVRRAGGQRYRGGDRSGSAASGLRAVLHDQDGRGTGRGWACRRCSRRRVASAVRPPSHPRRARGRR